MQDMENGRSIAKCSFAQNDTQLGIGQPANTDRPRYEIRKWVCGCTSTDGKKTRDPDTRTDFRERNLSLAPAGSLSFIFTIEAGFGVVAVTGSTRPAPSLSVANFFFPKNETGEGEKPLLGWWLLLLAN
jgi:hypothetical protein